MTAPKPDRSSWTLAGIIFFAVAVSAVPLVCCRTHPRHKPLTLVSLVARAESELGLHPVAYASHGNPAGGVYLCRDEGRRREDLPTARQRAFLDHWRGVVLVVVAPTGDSDFDAQMRDWGDAAAIVDGLVLWGEPELVAAIVRELSTVKKQKLDKERSGKTGVVAVCDWSRHVLKAPG